MPTLEEEPRAGVTVDMGWIDAGEAFVVALVVVDDAIGFAGAAAGPAVLEEPPTFTLDVNVTG